MRYTRVLTIDDADHIISIYTELEKIRSVHQPIEKFVWFQNRENVKNVLSQDNAVFVGTFDDDILVSSIRMSFWKAMPHWLLGNVVTRIKTFSFNMERNGLADTMKMAISIAEERQCYRFYTAISERQMNKFLFDRWIKHVPELIDYVYVIEAELDEDAAVSQYEAYNIMFQGAKLPKPYVSKYYIRSATATNKRRNFKIFNEKPMLKE